MIQEAMTDSHTLQFMREEYEERKLLLALPGQTSSSSSVRSSEIGVAIPPIIVSSVSSLRRRLSPPRRHKRSKYSRWRTPKEHQREPAIRAFTAVDSSREYGESGLWYEDTGPSHRIPSTIQGLAE